MVNSFPIDMYLSVHGVWDFGIALGKVISSWLIIVPPLTISSIISKLMLFTDHNNKKILPIITPVIVFVFSLIFYFISFELTKWLGHI